MFTDFGVESRDAVSRSGKIGSCATKVPEYHDRRGFTINKRFGCVEGGRCGEVFRVFLKCEVFTVAHYVLDETSGMVHSPVLSSSSLLS